MTTDITEKGLETLIFRHMTGADGLATADEPFGAADVARPAGGTGYDVGRPGDYDRTHALDVVQLFAFLRATQPVAFDQIGMRDTRSTRRTSPG